MTTEDSLLNEIEIVLRGSTTIEKVTVYILQHNCHFLPITEYKCNVHNTRGQSWKLVTITVGSSECRNPSQKHKPTIGVFLPVTCTLSFCCNLLIHIWQLSRLIIILVINIIKSKIIEFTFEIIVPNKMAITTFQCHDLSWAWALKQAW